MGLEKKENKTLVFLIDNRANMIKFGDQSNDSLVWGLIIILTRSKLTS